MTLTATWPVGGGFTKFPWRRENGLVVHVAPAPPKNAFAEPTVPAWLESVIESFTDIGMLEYGWDGAQAQPLSDRALATAVTVLIDTMSFDTVPPQIVPTYEGGLQLEWHCAGVDLEVCVESHGQVSVWFHESGREWEEERYPRARLSKELSLLTRAYVD